MSKKILYFVLVMLTFLLGTVHTFAYWNNLSHTTEITIAIGEWEFSIPIPNFDPQEDYDVDDTFVYDNRVWIITGSWFNGSNFLNPDGTVNTNYVKPYGPIQEVTNEWRSYNTYTAGSVVTHQGYEWVVRHEGANSDMPGSDTNAWNRISDNWFIYNTYDQGEIVLYNGAYWISKTSNRKQTPGLVPWAWDAY